jgi:hypothetical protein
MANFADFQHHISQDLFGIILNLRFLQKLSHNHSSNSLILGELYVRIPLGTTHNQLETLIQNYKNILIVNVIVHNVLVYAVHYGLDDRLRIV